MTTLDAILIVLVLATGFPSAAALVWWGFVAFHRMTSANKRVPWMEAETPRSDLIVYVLRIPPEVKV